MPNSQFYTTKIWVSKSKKDVFAFFSDLNNLVLLTPPLMNMRIDETYLKEKIKYGTTFQITIGFNPIVLKWQSEIIDWNPFDKFTDRQTSGPYSKWIHSHSFIEVESGTWIVDNIEYTPKIFPIIGKYFYKILLKLMFRYRDKQVKKFLLI